MQDTHARSDTAVEPTKPAALPVPAWLTYDSRSGSTSLSAFLSGFDGRIWVTPEIGFDAMLRRTGDCGAAALGAMADESVAAGDWRNLGLDRAAIGAVARRVAAEEPSGDVRRAFATALLAEAAAVRGIHGVTRVLVKNGSHLRWIPRLRQVFGPDTRIVFLVRDPRAVAESKLRTVRPYRPWETFAWGGALHCAWRWRDYARQAAVAAAMPATTLTVRFEDFAQDRETHCLRIARHLGLSGEVGDVRARDYRIPDREQAIHFRAAAGRFETAALDEWRGRLGARERAVIEWMCREEMRALGYEAPSAPMHRLALPCTVEAARTAWGVARHTVLTWHHRKDLAAGGPPDDS